MTPPPEEGVFFFIQTFRNNQLVYNLRAETITWDTSTNKWKLDNILERRIDGLKETLNKTGTMQMKYNFKPRDFQRDEYMKDKMATGELNEFIHLEKERGSEIVNSLLLEKYNRTAIPASVLVLTMIAAILASRKKKGGAGYHLLMAVIICLSYILISRFSVVFALKANFNAFLAAWVPNIFFAGVTMYLYKTAPK